MWNDAFPLAAMMDPNHLARVSDIPLDDRLKGEGVLRKLLGPNEAASAQMQLKVAAAGRLQVYAA